MASQDGSETFGSEVFPDEVEAMVLLGIKGRPEFLRSTPWRMPLPPWPESAAEKERRLIMETYLRHPRHFWRGEELWEDLVIIAYFHLSTGTKLASYIAVPNTMKRCTCPDQEAIKAKLKADRDAAAGGWWSQPPEKRYAFAEMHRSNGHNSHAHTQ